MIFFTDENISTEAAKLLEAFDRCHEIRAHRHCFDPGTPDSIWINGVAGWHPKPAVICGDGRILKNKTELASLREAELMFVYLASGWTNLAWNEFAWKIVKAWPSIVQSIEKTRKATVFKVGVRNLKVERIGLIADLGEGK